MSTATIAQEISEEQKEHYREVLADPDFTTIFMKAKIHELNDVLMVCITIPEEDGGALGNCFRLQDLASGMSLLQEAQRWAEENEPVLLIDSNGTGQGA